MQSKVRRVLLLMHNWSGYLHEIQLGISEYLAQRPQWFWTRMLPLSDQLASLPHTVVDGVIAYVETDYQAALQAMGVPVVDVASWTDIAPFPRVLPDDAAIGRLAAQYFIELGLKHLGTIGPTVAFSRTRQQSLARAADAAGVSCHHFGVGGQTLPPGVTVPMGLPSDLAAWLLQLPKPIGILATHNSKAEQVLEVCNHMRIKVPDEVCVLGVENDELTAKFTHPPLSTIDLPAHKIGFEAARLLDKLMDGSPSPQEPIRLPPVRVVARQSTNVLAISDEDVLEAVRYIRERVHEQVTVRDLLRLVPLNRRYLERKFKQHLGRSPLQEIRHSRVEKAKDLLAGTDLSMPAVAKHSGFPNPERLANVFHDMTGLTPTAYRRKFRRNDR